MRFMHIGDLHLGRTINQHLLLEDQALMLDQIIEAIDSEAVDALIIAGDIFDRTLPSKEAILLFEDFIERVNIERKLPVLAISGNHDGAERLGYGKHWFNRTRFHLATHIDECFHPVQFDGIDVYLVPFIEPIEAKLYFEDDSITSHGACYARIMERINEQLDTSRKNIVVSHLFVQGGEETDSERPVSIGAIEFVNPEIFNGIDYVALGHLHHPFAVKSDRIFYSGSLLKYSFSEVNQPKGYRIVEINDTIDTRFVPLTPRYDMAVVEASYDDAVNNRLGLKDNDVFLKLILSDLQGVNDPMLKLKNIYPNLLELRHSEEVRDIDTVNIDIEHQSDISIMNQFMKVMTDQELTDNEQHYILNIMEGAHHETD